MGKKRGHGTGSVVRLRDGRWQARASYWENGRLKRKALYGRTRGEAERKLREFLQGLDHGLRPAPERVTLGQYLTEWLQAQSFRLRPSTQRQYEQTVRLHIVPAIGRDRLTTVTPTRIEWLLASLHEQGLAPNTIRLARAVLRRSLQDAVRDGVLSSNPAALARPIPIDPPRIAVWTVDETQQFLTASRTHWLWPLFATLVATGLRSGEALGLSWEHVDFERGTLVILHQLQRSAGTWRLLPPKSRQSRRTIPLSALAREALEQQRAQQLVWRASPAWQGNPWGLVFTTHTGTPLDARNVRHVFVRLIRQAGVPPMRLHDLRHLCATLALQAGTDLKVVSALLGHSQLSVTADYYAHVQLPLLAQAVTQIDQLLRQ